MAQRLRARSSGVSAASSSDVAHVVEAHGQMRGELVGAQRAQVESVLAPINTLSFERSDCHVNPSDSADGFASNSQRFDHAPPRGRRHRNKCLRDSPPSRGDRLNR